MKEPFYRKVIVTKCNGGKRTLWHARISELAKCEKEYAGSHACGAGNTADNAIKDLAEQIRRWNKRLANAGW